MTEEESQKFRRESLFRGVKFFQELIQSREALSEKDFAAQAGRKVGWVRRKHAEGAIYAYSLGPKSVEEVSAAFPERKAELSVISAFVEQGQAMLYPSWQIRRKGVIRPEVAMAREAFNLYAKELFDALEAEHKKAPASWKAPKLDPPPDDNKLFFFFMGGWGRGTGSLSEQIVKSKPNKPLTMANLKAAWWYRENPFGDFS